MNQKATAKRGFPYVSLILIVSLVLVVVIMGYTLIDSIGIIGHFDTAAKSNNYKITENHLDVYRYHVAQNQLYTEYMYYQYGMMQDYYGITKMYPNVQSYINAALPSYANTDSFDEGAYNYAEQYLAYCEGAREAGNYDAFVESTKADVDKYIEDLKATAKANDVSFSKYLRKWVGSGVTEKVLREAMTWYYVGIEYADELFEGYKDATELSEIEKYRDEHKGDFYTTKYTYYKLVNNSMKEDIEKCTTADEVKAVIVEYFVEQNFTKLYEEKITKANVTDEAGKDTTRKNVKTTLMAIHKLTEDEEIFTDKKTSDYEKAAYAIVTGINTSLTTELNKVYDTGSAAYTDPTSKDATDLQKWLFGNGRKEGDYKVITSTSTSSSSSSSSSTTTTTTNIWYKVDKVMVLDEEKTKNAYYLLLTDDDKEKVENAQTAEQKAAAMFAEFEKDPTAEKFAELVEKYAKGTSADLKEKISEKGVDEKLGEWLYAEGRKKGDIANIKTEKSGNFIVLFDGENEETWIANGREKVASEKLNDWFEAAVEKYNVTVDYSHEGHDHGDETTASTEASTSASTEAATEAATDATTEAATDAATDAETAA